MPASPGSSVPAAPSDGPAAPEARSRGAIGRAVPASGVGLLVLTFYLIQASLRKSPWNFTDELEWSQLSRSIAATGHAARRGQEIGLQSLYEYAIAPAWWLHGTAAGYEAVKTLNAAIMCAAAAPAYLLARRLVDRRSATAVALLSISIPAMSYATSIIPESLAYFWFALAAWLSVRALAAPTPGRVGLAVVAAAIGPTIRQEFVVLALSLAIAGAALWVLRARGPGGGGRGAGLPWRRGIAAAVLLVGFAYVFNRLVVEHFTSWQPTTYVNGHTLEEGMLAAGALAIGLGVIPVIGGLASLWLPERSGDPVYRAFALYLLAAIVCVVGYSAAKGTYLRGSFGTLIEERNVFYLSPLLLLGTAILLTARRVDWRLVGLATAAVVVTFWSSLFQVGAPYVEAPGLAILTLVNREDEWTVLDFHLLLLGATAVGLTLLALRGRRWVPPLAAVLVGAWLLTGEIYATSANDDAATVAAAKIPSDRSWIDRATGGAAVTFLGQTITDANPLWLTEFWNRSLHHVASLDGTASGPGPTFVPGLETTDGELTEATGDPYVLASAGIVPVGAPVAHDDRNGLTLYRIQQPWTLQQAVQNVYSDGWATSPAKWAYYPRGGAGVITIGLSRTAYNGTEPAGRATIQVGRVTFVDHSGPQLGAVLTVRHALIRNGRTTTVRIPVSSTPVFVVVTVSNPLSLPGDDRQLAAQESFSFARSG